MDCAQILSKCNEQQRHLIDIMMVKDAVEVFVNVIEHVHHFHGCAIMAKGSETHNITKVDSDLFKQLWIHNASLL